MLLTVGHALTSSKLILTLLRLIQTHILRHMLPMFIQ